MKTLDTLSKRILIVAVSLSLFLLSLSAFLLTIQRVTAEPKQQFPGMITPTRIGLGIDAQKRVGYYGLVNPDGSLVVYATPIPY